MYKKYNSATEDCVKELSQFKDPQQVRAWCTELNINISLQTLTQHSVYGRIFIYNISLFLDHVYNFC